MTQAAIPQSPIPQPSAPEQSAQRATVSASAPAQDATAQALEDLRTLIERPTTGLFDKQRAHPRFGPILAQFVRPTFDFLTSSFQVNFEKQVAQQGTRLAIQDDQESMTYDELNRAANRLAHRLLALELPRSSPIGVVMDKSCAALAATLAVWKSGNLLLLVEPDIAQTGLLEELTDYRLEALFTQATLLPQFESKIPADTRVLLIEETGSDTPTTNPPAQTGPEDLLSISFTSGSTGKRKFISSTQGRRLLTSWQQIEEPRLGPGDRFAAYHRLSAGPGLPSVIAMLLAGGTVYFYNSNNPAPRAFADWIRQHDITILSMPPVALGQFLEALKDADPLPSVRMIQSGGQTIHRGLAELFQSLFADGAILMARYAMSETGTLSTFHIDHTTPLDLPTIPAGYTQPARDIHIVDEEGRFVAPGEVGEIVIDTKLPPAWDHIKHVLKRVEGPATLDHPRPLYRSNDMGYMRPDGCLVHMGRKDDIVKIRGFRVSLLEVENALRQIPGVADAAARTFPSANGDNRLVGYVIPEPTAKTTLNTTYLHEQMTVQVAAHVVPTRFMLLDEFPLLSWGKLNRNGLPDPGNPRPALATPYRAPQNEIEAKLCELWADELEIDEVGADDSFFELGGDSILMTALLLAVERDWNQQMPPAFFDEPTVVHMARILETHGAETRGERVDAQPNGKPPANPTRSLTRKNPEGTPPTIRRKLYERLFEIGPALGNYCLPYGMGIRLQRRLVAQPAFQRRYPRSLARLRTWHELLGDPTPFEQVAIQHLLSNTWKEWRRQTLLQDPASFARWVTVEGAEYLAALGRNEQGGAGNNAGKGIIIIAPHTFINRVSTGLPQWSKRPYMTITGAESHTAEEVDDINHPRRMARRAAQVNQARHLLSQGGIVRIAGDGPAGYGGTTIALGNRQLAIRSGAAELAVEMDAVLIPLFATIAATGHITLHLTEPIFSDGRPRAEQIQAITEEYAQRYARFWPRQYASMNWGFLARALGSPQIAHATQPAAEPMA